MKFEHSFMGTVYPGETLETEIDCFIVTATIWADDYNTAPWLQEDGHGPVSEWTTRDKKPGELILNSDKRHKRYYDFQAACAIARRDGWDSKPYNDGAQTKRQQAAKAALSDFNRLRVWCNDQWCYVGVALQVTHGETEIDLTGPYGAALWGIESDCPDYLTEVANELLPEALQVARETLAKLKAA